MIIDGRRSDYTRIDIGSISKKEETAAFFLDQTGKINNIV